MTFDAWLNRVDQFLLDNIGMCHDDMEDWLWHDAYEAGIKPEDEARDYLIELGVFAD